VQTHVPVWQVWPLPQLPQETVFPQLLTALPHCLPAQAAVLFGTQTALAQRQAPVSTVVFLPCFFFVLVQAPVR
jgi:hypothetical protein